jgi:iron complex outermembrane recepter protein
MKVRLILSTCTAALLVAAGAQAQTAATGQSQAAPPPPQDTVEVIVTAQKRAQSVQKTPFAITAIKGDDIAAQGLNTVGDAIKDAPGVQIQSIAQGSQIFIRGVGSGIDPSFADPSIALMTDGVYSGRTESVQGGNFDIDRVEVLRGPQGTLYGRNASGGAVNVITNQAKLGVYEATVRAQLGNYDERRIEGMINLPLGDWAAVRVAGFSDKHNSYVDLGGDDMDESGVRLKIFAQPVEWLKLSAKVEAEVSKGYGPITVPVPGSAGNLTFPPPIFYTNFDPSITNGPPFDGGVPIERFPNGWVVKDPGNPWSNDVDHYGGAIDRSSLTYMFQADADLGWSNLTVLPSYSREKNYLLSSLFFGDLTGPYTVGEGTTQYSSVEARLTSKPDAPFVWLLGAYYLKSNGGLTFADQVIDNFNLSQEAQPGETKALFGQITYPLTDRFRITGGYRISQDTESAGYEINGINGTTYTSGPVNYTNTANSSSFKVGVEYDLAAHSLFYAHVASGFKQGGLSPSLTATPFLPEKLLAYEAGVKNRFFDNHLLLNGAVFYYDYKDYQLSFLQNETLPGTSSVFSSPDVVNAGPTHFYGAEVQTVWNVTRNDDISATLNYLHATYGEVVLPNNPFVNDGNFELKGYQMANSPDWSGNIGYTHSWNAFGGRMSAGFNTHWSTSYYVTDEVYEPGALQKAYTRSDANLRYMADKWSLDLYVKNIEDKAQTTYVFPLYRRYVSDPRTYGLTLERRF